jgi:hypothetical protein
MSYAIHSTPGLLVYTRSCVCRPSFFPPAHRILIRLADIRVVCDLVCEERGRTASFGSLVKASVFRMGSSNRDMSWWYYVSEAGAEGILLTAQRRVVIPGEGCTCCDKPWGASTHLFYVHRIALAKGSQKAPRIYTVLPIPRPVPA